MKRIIRCSRHKRCAGYALLEYAAGAAILLGVFYVGVRALGGGVSDLLTNVGDWARARSSDLNQSSSSNQN